MERRVVEQRLVVVCRWAGQWLVVDVRRRRDDSVVRHSPPLRQVRAVPPTSLTAAAAAAEAVLGRRDLPSRGLPAAPLKRCRSVHRHVDDDKENMHPDCRRERRRRRLDSRQSPDNHVYDTLEPASLGRSAASSPVYATIDSADDDAVDESTARRRQRFNDRLVSRGTRRRRHDSTCRSAKKRVTFNVSTPRIACLTTPASARR